jgi:hypothetical protein
MIAVWIKDQVGYAAYIVDSRGEDKAIARGSKRDGTRREAGSSTRFPQGWRLLSFNQIERIPVGDSDMLSLFDATETYIKRV